MKQLLFLLKKEFLQIRRNKFLLRLIVMMPILQIAILPWAATFEQKDISLVVIDNDKSTTSEKLINKVISSGFFKLTKTTNNYNEALTLLDKGKSDLIFEIPHDFEKNIVRENSSDIMLSIDALNGQKAGLGMSYISTIINGFSGELFRSSPAYAGKMPVSIKPYFKYNKNMDYKSFMVPGIIVILMSMLGAMLSALNIVREKELGTMEQINVTPLPKATFILGKIIPFWIIGLVILTIGMLIAVLLYGLVPLGSFSTIYLYALVYIIAFTGFGLIISNFARTQQQSMFMILFFLIIFILLSGLFTPIESMPDWMQKVTWFNPLRYFIEVMRLVYLKGSSFADILPQFLKTIAFTTLFFTLAIISYRKTTN